MLHLRKHLLPLLRAASHPIPTSAVLSNPLNRRELLLSTSASPAPFAVKDYLVSACGLTSAQALQASKKLSTLKSASNPDAVLALLSGVALTRPDIAAIVVSDPLLLCARAGNIAPRLATLRDRLGLSASQIARLLQVGSVAFRSCDIATKLAFWIPFFGNFDKLLQIVRRNKYLLKSDLERIVKPNIALLQQCGLSACDIAKMLMVSPWMLSFHPERVKQFVRRADELGVQRSLYTFKYTVGMACCLSEGRVATRMEFLSNALGCSMEKIRSAVRLKPNMLQISEEKLGSKIEFLRSALGCSKDELSVAVCKAPQLFGLTEEKLRNKIEFLVTEVGLEPDYIVERPFLLLYSLEKRLVPRHYVLKILQAKGLTKEHAGFLSVMQFGDKHFIEKFISCHKDAVPWLADAYAAVCAGKEPTTFNFDNFEQDVDCSSSFQACS